MNEFVQGNINFFLGACVGVAATAIMAFVALEGEYRRGINAGRKLTLHSIYGKMGQSLRSDENIIGKLAATQAYAAARMADTEHLPIRLYNSHCNECSWQANRLLLEQADVLAETHRKFHPMHSTATRITDEALYG